MEIMWGAVLNIMDLTHTEPEAKCMNGMWMNRKFNMNLDELKETYNKEYPGNENKLEVKKRRIDLFI